MKIRQIIVLIIVVGLIALTGCDIQRPSGETEASTAETGGATATPLPPYDPNEFNDAQRVPPVQPPVAFIPDQALIKFNQNASISMWQKAAQAPDFSIEADTTDPALSAAGIVSLEPLIGPVAQASSKSAESVIVESGASSQVFIAQLQPGSNVEQTVTKLNELSDVEYAEPNFVAYATGSPAYAPQLLTPNDEYFPFQWHMQAIQMPSAWDVSSGKGVIVAVLDTGAAYETYQSFVQAPDLAGTSFVAGYDFVNNDSHANDDNGHGTHVSGTIAQTTNNGEGVTGVAYNASIMPVKVLDRLGQGSFANIVQGINFAVANGAKVINMSLSAQVGSSALKEAVDHARASGVVVVAAAGNSNGPVEYPAKYASVIAVGATRFDNTRSRYSNSGPELDIVAPGGDNTVDQNGDGFGDGVLQQTFSDPVAQNFGYHFLEGTSMASPHVAGVVALLKSANPGLTPDQIETALEASALALTPADQYGAGLVQACAALNAVGAPCGSPVPPTVTPTPGGPTPPPVTPAPTETVMPNPTDTPAPGPTATPTSSPPGGGNIIINGGFEEDSAWVFPVTPRQGGYTGNLAHSGNRSARVGIVEANNDRYSYSSVVQKITIPANATKATLNAYVYPVSTETPYSYDAQMTLVLNSRFRVVETLAWGLSNEQSWNQQTFDLTKYKGQTIYIYFGALNTRQNGKVTALYVDDVSVVIEP